MLSGAMAAMLAGVLRWYASPPSLAHYRHWSAAWAAQAAYYLIGGLAFSLAVLQLGGPVVRLIVSATTQSLNSIAALLLALGAVGFARRQTVDVRAWRVAIFVSVALGTLVAVLSLSPDTRLIRPIYRASITGASFLGSGIVIWRSRPSSDRAGRFLSLSLLGFGLANVHYLTYWLLTAAGRRPGYLLSWFTLFDLLWIAAIATTMVAMGLADQQDEAAVALHQRERDFRRMIEKSSDIITTLDASMALRYASPSATRLLGWGVEVIGQPVLDFVHPDDRAMVQQQFASPPERTAPFQVRVRSKPGNWVRLEAVTTRAVNDAGETVVIVNARDVTERERLEASLRESQKLESVGRLAGGVAHDLNNILTVIGGNAQLALPESEGEVRKELEEISAATLRAADLTKQLLAFARRQIVAPRTLNVPEVVAHTARLAARLLPATIDFRLKPSAGDHFVRIDPGQLEQVVLNLVVNARDAILDRGRIDLEVDSIALSSGEVPELGPGRYVAIVVRDTGSGIPDAVRPHLFEPFFTTKAMGEGTGLGLATTYGIVRQGGGSIRVESQVGAGSTFSVLLPAVEGDVEGVGARPDGAVAKVEAAGHGELVLVVEDDDAVRQLQCDALTRSGFRVIQASNGVAAMALATDHPSIAVLVSDVVMPRLGGVDLARRLREQQPSLGVLLLSGYPGEGDFVSTLPPHTEFLQKPVLPLELVRRVRALLPAAGRR